jgi:hypothetical protein
VGARVFAAASPEDHRAGSGDVLTIEFKFHRVLATSTPDLTLVGVGEVYGYYLALLRESLLQNSIGFDRGGCNGTQTVSPAWPQ